MRSEVQLATFRGIPIRAHWSMFLALVLLGSVYARNFAAAALAADIPPEKLSGSLWVWGLLVAAGLFVSVLLHELAHCIYALRVGGKVDHITLLILGGISHLSVPPKEGRHETITALVGPLASLALGGFLLGAHALTASLEAFNLRFALFSLGSLNVVLGLFNLLPAFPMDGGRILRSLLTTRLGRVRATKVAAGVGKVFAIAFAVVGVLSFSFILVLIAVFIYAGAAGEARMVVTRELLASVRVADVMTPMATPIRAESSVSDALARMRAERSTALPVVRDDRVVGVVTLNGVRSVSRSARASARVGGIVHEVLSVLPTDSVNEAIERLDAAAPLVPVVDGAALVGTVSLADIERAVELRNVAERRRVHGSAGA